jgi:hypothetical protein
MMRTIAVALAAFWLVSFGVLAQGSGTSTGTTGATSDTTKSDTMKSDTKKAKKKHKKAKKAAKSSGTEETPGGGARTGETPK